MKAAGNALAAKSKVSAESAAPASAPAGVDDPTAEQLKIVRMMLADLDNGGEYSREEQYLLGKVRAESSLSLPEVQTLISRVLYEEYVTKRPYSKGMARLRTANRTIEDEKPGGEKGQALKSPGNVAAKAPFVKNVKASPQVAITSAFSEGFDAITTLPGSGWSLQNLSNPVGTTGWFQGNDAVFPAQAGATTAYIGANFNNTGSVGNISNWLLTPEIGLKNGDVIKFWTRKPTGTDFPDRLEVRMSTNGASTNVGASDSSVDAVHGDDFGFGSGDDWPRGFPLLCDQRRLERSELGLHRDRHLRVRAGAEPGGDHGSIGDADGGELHPGQQRA